MSSWARLAATACLLGSCAHNPQESPSAAPEKPGKADGERPLTLELLPGGDVVRPFVADVREPHPYGTLAWIRGGYSSLLGVTALGETLALARLQNLGPLDALQLGLTAAVSAQFDLLTASSNLVNADYLAAIPLTMRRGQASARLRLYHVSSHLGDEYLLAARPQRINFSFLSLELLGSYERGAWRVYGGGDWMLVHDQDDVRPLLGHAGAELRPAWPLLDLGPFGIARWLVATDLKSRLAGGGIDLSLRTGITVAVAGRSWLVLAEYYRGRSPFGQFYREPANYIGFGVHWMR